MQGAVRTGPERTGSYVRTGSTAATQQMAFHGLAPRRLLYQIPPFHDKEETASLEAR